MLVIQVGLLSEADNMDRDRERADEVERCEKMMMQAGDDEWMQRNDERDKESMTAVR